MDPRLHGAKQRGSTLPPAQETVQLGAKIRELRKSTGWTLEDLARSVGLSRSAISQIESGKMEPSLQTLRSLAAALKIPLARLFQTSHPTNGPVVRRGMRKVFFLPRNRLRYELLTPDLIDKRVEFLRVELDPDPAEQPAPYTHEGEEYGIVISGMAEILLDGTKYLLKPGDSIFFRAMSPHYVRNAGRRPAVMIWAISPPTY